MDAFLRHPARFWRDHRFTMAHASDYLDGALDPAGRARVERHAHVCPKCHELLRSLRGLLAALRELRVAPDPVPRPDLAPRIVARLRGEG